MSCDDVRIFDGTRNDPVNEDDALPIAEWELPGLRQRLPESLRAAMGTSQSAARMSPHAWRGVQPGGDHAEDQDEFNRLTLHLNHWLYLGASRKGRHDETRWEVYSPINDRYFVLTVLGESSETSEISIISFYRIKRRRVLKRKERENLLAREH